MSEPTLILTFNKDGSVEKETTGFNGKSCTEVTQFIEKALGAVNENKRFKPEYTRSNAPNQNRIQSHT
jgi:hypothetical protein